MEEVRDIESLQDLVKIRDIFDNSEKYAEKEIKIAGWVKNSRAQKQLCFVSLSDGTHFNPLQLIFENDVEGAESSNENPVSNYLKASGLSVGESIICRGKLRMTPDMPQPFELVCNDLIIEGDCPTDYPLQPKRHTREFLRSIPHLRPKANLFQAAFKLRSEMAFAIHEFFHKRNFVYVHTPILTETDAEGAGEMFTVTCLDMDDVPKTKDGKVDYSQDFFGEEAKLTVTGQLEGECFAQAFRDIYTFGPTFRAEKSYTGRHAAEFWMIEPEMAFTDIYGNMAVAEDMVKYIINHCFEHCKAEMEFFDKFVEKGKIATLQNLINSDFAHISYTEAIESLKKAKVKFEFPVEWGMDLQTEHERYICEKLMDRPVFVTDYPKDIKAFYMKQNSDGKTVRGMDLLVPGVGEIIGGSQREENYAKILQRIEELHLKEEAYTWYLDLRRYGTVRHAGYGLGFERMLMYVSGINNIRDVIPFPRTAGHMSR